MSRSNYSDDCDGWELIRWRGAVASAIRGKRGQQFLRELIAALDAMPVKELIPNELELDGQVCALGAVGKQRGMDLSAIDPEDRKSVCAAFGIPEALAAEIMFLNDEDFCYWRDATGAKRWEAMRQWAVENLKQEPRP